MWLPVPAAMTYPAVKNECGCPECGVEAEPR